MTDPTGPTTTPTPAATAAPTPPKPTAGGAKPKPIGWTRAKGSVAAVADEIRLADTIRSAIRGLPIDRRRELLERAETTLMDPQALALVVATIGLGGGDQDDWRQAVAYATRSLDKAR